MVSNCASVSSLASTRASISAPSSLAAMSGSVAVGTTSVGAELTSVGATLSVGVTTNAISPLTASDSTTSISATSMSASISTVCCTGATSKSARRRPLSRPINSVMSLMTPRTSRGIAFWNVSVAPSKRIAKVVPIPTTQAAGRRSQRAPLATAPKTAASRPMCTGVTATFKALANSLAVANRS